MWWGKDKEMGTEGSRMAARTMQCSNEVNAKLSEWS